MTAKTVSPACVCTGAIKGNRQNVSNKIVVSIPVKRVRMFDDIASMG